jgi:hypothetical protein
MRDRPFISAGESPRPFSEIRAERGDDDERARTWREVASIEAEATGADDEAERKRLQCQAEALRAGLHEFPRRC